MKNCPIPWCHGTASRSRPKCGVCGLDMRKAWPEERDKVADQAFGAIVAEYAKASEAFPRFNSAHEGFAVLLEEVEELKAEVFKNAKRRDPNALKAEATQVGAMALRFIVDVCTP